MVTAPIEHLDSAVLIIPLQQITGMLVEPSPAPATARLARFGTHPPCGREGARCVGWRHV